MKTNKSIIHKGLLTRHVAIERRNVDEEARTVSLSFSSEEPVKRWYGTEILDHGRGSVDLSRLNDGAPLLVNHDTRDHVGVVESASVGSDRRGRAVVRFGESERANEIFKDVVSGVRRNISVGYLIEKTEVTNDEVYRAMRWIPHEITLASIPADATVGVGRTDSDIEHSIEVIDNRSIPNIEIVPEKERKEDIMDNQDEKQTALSADEIREQAEKLATDLHVQRMGLEDKIRATAKAHNQEEVGETAVRNRNSWEDFRTALLDDYVGRVKPLETSVDDPDLTEKERQRFSLTRVLATLANPDNKRIREEAAFEMECSDDIAKRMNASAQGIFIPKSAFGQGRRELTVGTATDGAELVATNLLASEFIDVLRNHSAVIERGARVLEGLVGDVAIPRKTSGSAGAWISTETGDSAVSEPQFDQVTLAPGTVGAYGEFSRQLFLQSTPSIDGLLQDDLAMGIATAIDLAALEGSGSSGQPAGIRNQTGVLTSTIGTAAAPTWVEIVEFETDVAVSNALFGTIGWITRAEIRGALKTTEKATDTAQFIMAEGNELNGYPVSISQQPAASGIFFGNWADLLIGMWGSLDMLVDPYTGSLAGTIRIVALQSADVAVRHPTSFSMNV